MIGTCQSVPRTPPVKHRQLATMPRDASSCLSQTQRNALRRNIRERYRHVTHNVRLTASRYKHAKKGFFHVQFGANGTLRACVHCFRFTANCDNGAQMQLDMLRGALNENHGELFQALQGTEAVMLMYNEFSTPGEWKDAPPPLAIAAWPKQHVLSWPSFNSFHAGWPPDPLRKQQHVPVRRVKPPPWHTRHTALVWRGSDAPEYGTSRSNVMRIARERPELANAYAVSKANMKMYMNESEQARYRYGAYTAGVARLYAWRLPLLLNVHATFMEETQMTRGHAPWFAPFLRAGEHYLPVRDGFGDLAQRIEAANAAPDATHRVHLAGRRFASRMLLSEECVYGVMRLYLRELARHWSHRPARPLTCSVPLQHA